MSHEPLGIMSVTFRGSQQQWATVDKEGFAIVSTFRRFENLLWGKVFIYTELGVHFQIRGVFFVDVKDCGAAPQELEDGVREFRLHDHVYSW